MLHADSRWQRNEKHVTLRLQCSRHSIQLWKNAGTCVFSLFRSVLWNGYTMEILAVLMQKKSNLMQNEFDKLIQGKPSEFNAFSIGYCRH